MNKGKCPKCEKVLREVETEDVIIGRPPYDQWRGVSYLCPHCHTVVGMQMDPISLRHDTVAMIIAGVKGK